jgi:hypothetical protein
MHRFARRLATFSRRRTPRPTLLPDSPGRLPPAGRSRDVHYALALAASALSGDRTAGPKLLSQALALSFANPRPRRPARRPLALLRMAQVLTPPGNDPRLNLLGALLILTPAV